MRAVGLKVLKGPPQRIYPYRVGRTVLVTDRDRVVAEIVPPHAGRVPLVADALLAEAVRRGWISPPALAADTPPPRKPVMTFGDLMGELQRDRADR
jgi:antitoxin (DNA-binding transcriptional repressor) of toxin-antitoxin stability system